MEAIAIGGIGAVLIGVVFQFCYYGPQQSINQWARFGRRSWEKIKETWRLITVP